MADRYDPRLSPRGAERKSGAAGGAVDDPLAELAKIVSGRTGGSRSRSAPANDPAASPSGGDVLGDLETELLNDLQASFAAVRDMVGTQPTSRTGVSPAPAPSAPPVQRVAANPPPPAQTVAPPPKSPPAAPASRAPSPAPPPPADVSSIEIDFDILAAGLAERLAPQPPPPPVEPPEAAPAPRARAPMQSEQRSDVRTPRQPPQPEPRFLSEHVPERIERPRAERSSDGADLGGFRQRASDQPSAAPPPSAARPARSRWDKPASDGSRFAPPKTPPAAKAAPADDDGFDAYDDFEAEADAVADFPLDGFGDLPADGEVEPPLYQDDLASMVERKRSRTPLLVAGVVAVVLVGGVAVAMFRPGGDMVSGDPPVIVADGAPTKITPDEPVAADAEGSNKLIYDRVSPTDGTAEPTVLAAGSEPIADVAATADANNPITRVIIPGGPGVDQPGAVDDGLSLDGQPSTIASAEAVAGEPAETSQTGEAIGPRKVRTVVVKPDGTIVESAAAEAAPAVTADASSNVQAEPPAAPEATVAATEPAAAPPVTDDTAAIAGAAGELAITPLPESTAGEQTAAAIAPEPVPVAPEPEPAPAPAPPQQVAVAPAPAPEVTQSAPVPAGGMLVQVSSQRTEDAARTTFRDLQARYPNILGPYEVNIQRADIPDRGTFFRVRVGPFSASDAQRLCDDLKAAGGDCILAQR